MRRARCRRRTRGLGAIGLALLLAPVAVFADGAATVSFKVQIQPIFNAQCVFCHVTGAENGGLNLGHRDSYASLMAPSTEAPLQRIAPGDPGKSYLTHKLDGTHLSVGGNGNAMPMSDPPRLLEPSQRLLFETWIGEGAQNN